MTLILRLDFLVVMGFSFFISGMERARWDLNPRSPASQASVLIQPRLRAQNTGLRCSDYCKGKILTALIKLENRG